MSDKTILILGGGLLVWLLLNRRPPETMRRTDPAPTLHDQQDYWLKMAGINLAGVGIQSLAKAAAGWNTAGSTSTAAALIDGGAIDYDSAWGYGQEAYGDISEWL
ncbi:hypothetical protein AZOA_33030 [Azoarcus sp. Aa7]|nr:hypothetical protein [Azoarcus sp. Aa7]